MDIFDRLRQFEILAHFSDPQLERLAQCSSRIQRPKDTLVLKEGDTTRDLYFIDVGEIQIQRNTPYGCYKLALLKTGDVFGETSFVDDNARSGDALIVSDTTLFRMNPNSLAPAMEKDQRFTLALYWALWKSLSSKLRKTNETLAGFFSKTGSLEPRVRSRDEKPDAIHVGVSAKRDLFREQKLSPMEINFMATLSKEEKFPPNEYIFHEGESGDRMFVVLQGQVMISKQIVDAGEEALAFLERGDYFGEMALIDQQPRSADARAHDNGAVVLSISRDVLEGILDIQKVSSHRLLHLLCNLVAKRLREIDDKLVGWYIFSAGSGETLDTPL
jgi:CRP-like cAMP-binding protein